MMGDKRVDEYLTKHVQWKPQLEKLRKMFLATSLEETLKWGAPAYTFNGKNVVGLVAFKNHFAIWLHQGALLKVNTNLLYEEDDPEKTMRQIRFTNNEQVDTDEILPYILEAIQNVKDGKKINVRPKKKLEIPIEMSLAFKEDSELRLAFEKLTPGKQREYASHISDAKRAETREKRLKRILPIIKAGKGLHDKYKAKN